MNVQLRVIVDGNIEFIELYGNESITLEVSFAEIQDVTKKNSAFTKEFNVPGSKNNNYIFNYFFDFNQVPLDWIPTRKFEAEILYNGYLIAAGYVRLNSVTITGLEKQYNITFYNGVGDLAANIGDKFMNELDTTSINHPISAEVFTYSQLDPNLFNLKTNTNYSYQNGKTFWGIYNIGYEYSETLEGAGLAQFYSGIEGVGSMTISAGLKAFKAVYTQPNSVILNVNDYIRTTASGTTNYIEGYVTRVEREAVYFEAAYGLGTGTYTMWNVEIFLPQPEINKSITPLLSFSPPLYTGNTTDNSSAKPGYFDFSGTPLNDFYLKPAVQVKTLYELIVNQSGYLIDSEFFGTNYFEKFYLPLKFEDTIYPQGATTPCYNFSSSTITLVAGPGLQYLNPQVGNTCNNINFTTNSTTIFLGTYTGIMKWQFKWTQKNNISCVGPTDPYVYFAYTDGTFPVEIIYNNTSVCAQENIDFIVEFPTPTNGQLQFGFVGDVVNISGFTANLIDSTKVLVSGSTFNYADEFPQDEFKQIDFITSINKLFNLVVIPHPTKQKTLIVEPIIDYIGKGEILDWSEKLDYSSPITVVPTTNILNGTLDFNLKLDQDFYNQQFNISQNRIFGTYEIQLSQDYKDEVVNFDTIFGSPTDYPIPETSSPIITAPSMYAVKTKQVYESSFLRFEPFKIIPRIIFRGNVEPNDNYKLGVYYYLENNSLDRWQNLNRFNTYPFSYTGFSHYLNFNSADTYQSNESLFPTQQDMYDIYYYDYISDITSQENKLISAKMYLTPWEIANLRFDERIFIKNNYYRVNKISNFNLTEPSLCDVELIKLTKSYTPHPVKYFKLTSCDPLFETLYTTSDLNYNIYAYIDNYVKVFSSGGTYYGCFLVEEDNPRYDVDYFQYYIGSGYTSTGVGVYDNCDCTGRTAFDIVQQNYPTPPPSPSPTPSPTITPTPTVTPSPTPPSWDYYLADEYNCSTCTVSAANVIVRFPSGTSVTTGFFYNDVLVTGFVYEIISSTSGPSFYTTCTLPGQSTCAAACSL